MTVEPSASIGISLFPEDARTDEELLEAADLAMYAAKAGGRGHYHRYREGLLLVDPDDPCPASAPGQPADDNSNSQQRRWC